MFLYTDTPSSKYTIQFILVFLLFSVLPIFLSKIRVRGQHTFRKHCLLYSINFYYSIYIISFIIIPKIYFFLTSFHNYHILCCMFHKIKFYMNQNNIKKEKINKATAKMCMLKHFFDKIS